MLNKLHHRPIVQLIVAIIAGSVAVLGYAPFYLYPMTILAMVATFQLWKYSPTSRHTALLGYAFGLGLFGAGVSWKYVSLHDFGNMPAWLAAIATSAFCAFLALFPALAGWITHQLSSSSNTKNQMIFVVVAPTAWVLIEWVRSWIFTGFPWLTIGYSQVPYSPFAGFAPVFGIYGVSLVTTAFAALIAMWRHAPLRKNLIIFMAILWLTGSGLGHVKWSTPQGTPVSFSLLQGNIAEDLKWREEEIQHTLETYLTMAKQSHAQLIVLPETAIPLLRSRVPANYLDALANHAKNNGGDMLIGIVESENDASGKRYFNSMISAGTSPTQSYRKSHLVPFGEFIPLKPMLGWIYTTILNMPLSDLAPGETTQKALSLADQKVAVNICYEDAFGEEVIRQLPGATLLVNTSNDAWYGDSLAAHQHMQLSQARALETGRMMLRATNTGATAVIDRDGQVLQEAPFFTATSLDGLAQGYIGSTPYVRYGNWPVVSLILLVLGLLWARKKK